jgi:CBS domain-containing protein
MLLMGQITKSISEVLSNRPPVLVGRVTTVAEAAHEMRRLGSASVLVMEQGVLIGIFTERDFLNRVAGPGLDPGRTLIGDVMTKKPVSLRLTDCVSYAINCMANGGFRHVPVLDSQGRPVGVLAPRDVTAHLHEVFGPAEEPAEPGFEAWVDIGGG